MRHALIAPRRRFPLQGGVPYIKAGLNGIAKPDTVVAPPVRARWARGQGYGMLATQRPPRFNYGVAAHAGALTDATIPQPRWREAAGYGLIPPQRVPRFNYGLAAHSSPPDVVTALRLPGRGRVSLFLRPATVNYGLPARAGPAEIIQRPRLRLPGTARVYQRPATFNLGVAWHADESHAIQGWRRSAFGHLSAAPVPHSAPAAPSGLPRARVVQAAPLGARGVARMALVPRFNLSVGVHAPAAHLITPTLRLRSGRAQVGSRIAGLLARAGTAQVVWVRPRRARGAALWGWHPFAPVVTPAGGIWAGPGTATEGGSFAATATESGALGGTASESGSPGGSASESGSFAVTVSLSGGYANVTVRES